MLTGFYLNNFKGQSHRLLSTKQVTQTKQLFVLPLESQTLRSYAIPSIPVTKFSKPGRIRTDTLPSPFLLLGFLQNCHNFVSSGEMVLMIFFF